MSDDLSSSEEVVWRALVKKDRPLWKRLFAQTLAQAQVRSPDGTPYVVRVSRNSPFKPGNVGDVNSAIELAVENVRRAGNTGWSITVLEPPGGLAGARELYRQEVQAQAIVVDVAFVIVEALRRGDRLWV